MAELAPAPTATTTTDEARKYALAQAVANEVRGGWGVQSQTDFQAVLVKGNRPNHLLHLVLTFVTLGLWAFVWVAVALIGGEKHRVVTVDEYGNVNRQ
jgi:hypothetical protein